MPTSSQPNAWRTCCIRRCDSSALEACATSTCGTPRPSLGKWSENGSNRTSLSPGWPEMDPVRNPDTGAWCSRWRRSSTPAHMPCSMAVTTSRLSCVPTFASGEDWTKFRASVHGLRGHVPLGQREQRRHAAACPFDRRRTVDLRVAERRYADNATPLCDYNRPHWASIARTSRSDHHDPRE